jgi:hypothetical protein
LTLFSGAKGTGKWHYLAKKRGALIPFDEVKVDAKAPLKQLLVKKKVLL